MFLGGEGRIGAAEGAEEVKDGERSGDRDGRSAGDDVASWAG